MRKSLLIIALLGVVNTHAVEFPKIINNTKWKLANTKNETTYTVLEFSDRFQTFKYYINGKLEEVRPYKMTEYQIVGSLLFVWSENYSTPDIFEMKNYITDFGDVILLRYGFSMRERLSDVTVYIPLEE